MRKAIELTWLITNVKHHYRLNWNCVLPKYKDSNYYTTQVVSQLNLRKENSAYVFLLVSDHLSATSNIIKIIESKCVYDISLIKWWTQIQDKTVLNVFLNSLVVYL